MVLDALVWYYSCAATLRKNIVFTSQLATVGSNLGILLRGVRSAAETGTNGSVTQKGLVMQVIVVMQA